MAPRAQALSRVEQAFQADPSLGRLGWAEDLVDRGIAGIDWNGKICLAWDGRWIAHLSTESMGQSQAERLVASATSPALTLLRDLGNGFYDLAAPAGLSLQSVFDSLRGLDPAAQVEPDFLIWADAIPNDPLFSQLWGLNNTGQTGGLADADIDAPEAWSISTGSDSRSWARSTPASTTRIRIWRGTCGTIRARSPASNTNSTN